MAYEAKANTSDTKTDESPSYLQNVYCVAEFLPSKLSELSRGIFTNIICILQPEDIETERSNKYTVSDGRAGMAARL